MGYVTGGGGGSSGAVTSVAGKTGVVTLASGDVVGDAPLANPTFTGTVTLPSSTVTNAMLAGSIAASKITGTAVTAADTGTVTSAMIADATITGTDIASSVALAGSPTTTTQARLDNSTKIASTAYVDVLRATYYYAGSQANIASTYPRHLGGAPAATLAIGTTGQMASWAILLEKGQIVTNILFRSGSTAGSAMTHWWVALYDTQATPALIAQSADQGSAAIAATAIFTLALGSPAPYTVTTTGIHYVSLSVTATTVPTITGSNVATAALYTGLASGQKTLAVTSGSALGATAPSTITSASTLLSIAYIEVS